MAEPPPDSFSRPPAFDPDQPNVSEAPPTPEPDSSEPDSSQGAFRGVVLHDAWAPQQRLVLNGWFERNNFAPLLMAFLVGIACFIFFQLMGAVVAIGLIVAREGVEATADLPSLLENQIDLLLVGNTVGQFIGFALPVLIIGYLHARPPWGFLRIRRPDPLLFGLAVVGLLTLLPLVQWVSIYNAEIPMPEWMEAFEQEQMAFLEKVLEGDTGLWFNLMALAITPALCEELFFRGYLQRQVERSLGVPLAILLTGIGFGLYHLRFSQVVPLSILGVYLCYLAWRTGSVWPAVLVHFMNNGLALLLNAYAQGHPELDIESIDTLPIPWYVLVVATGTFVFIIRAMNDRARALLRDQGAPVSSVNTTYHQPL